MGGLNSTFHAGKQTFMQAMLTAITAPPAQLLLQSL